MPLTIHRRRESVYPRGLVRIAQFDALTGKLLREDVGSNLVVNSGKDLVRDFLAGDTVSGLTKFKLGTSNTAAAAGDIALGATVFTDLITQRIKTAQMLTVKYYLSSLNANGHTLREAGVFTPTDTMYARYILSPSIGKTVAIAVTFTWEFTWT